jgi:hypothetical protein
VLFALLQLRVEFSVQRRLARGIYDRIDVA